MCKALMMARCSCSPVYFAVSEGQLDIVVPGYGVQADLLCETHVNNKPSMINVFTSYRFICCHCHSAGQ